MKKMLSASIVTIALMVLIGCVGSAPAQNRVVISDSGFAPAEVSIKVGGTVEWANKGTTLHTVTTADFDSQAIRQGGAHSRTFEKAGTYAYFCRYHPTETGTVTAR